MRSTVRIAQRDGDDGAAADVYAESSCLVDAAAPHASAHMAGDEADAQSLRAWLATLGLQQHADSLLKVLIIALSIGKLPSWQRSQ